MSTNALIQGPRIPSELAEVIIDNLNKHVRSLRACALTCRAWHPRSRYHILSSIRIESREHLASICEYFTSHPQMTELVRSILVAPAGSETNPRSLLEALPVRLLSQVRNLQRYSVRYSSTNTQSLCAISLHPITLVRIKVYFNVDELNLGPLEFRSPAELARLLAAVPRLRVLICTDLTFANDRDLENINADLMRFRDKCGSLCEIMVRSEHLNV